VKLHEWQENARKAREAAARLAGSVIDEVEVWLLLDDIEAGRVVIPEREKEIASKLYSGVVTYAPTYPDGTLTGWVVSVFNDCDSWDYLEHVTAPDGRSMAFREMNPNLQAYRPEKAGARALWGLEP
jgi:hypothetical protein